jgi:hypothetical protein
VNDLDALMSFWTNLLGLTPQNGWRVTWGWVDQIPHPEGGEAVGLNRTDGAAQVSHISIRRPRTDQEWAELDDTCAHESVHCLGVRMQAMLDAGKDVEAHEYLAETLAPAMVKIKGTPKAKYLAKALQTLPARAKGKPMDPKAILAMLAMIEAASNPEEKAKLLAEMKAQLEANVGAPDAGPASVAPPPLGAPPPPPPMEEKKPDAPPPLGMGEPDPKYKKLVADTIETLVEVRGGLTPEQAAHVRTLPTVEAARAYFKAHPTAAPAPAPQLGLPQAPRGGPDTSMVAPSGDKHTMALFRIMPGSKSTVTEEDGVTVHDPGTTGKLISFSTINAFNVIRRTTQENTHAMAKRAVGAS